jgi:hypothetical protein
VVVWSDLNIMSLLFRVIRSRYMKAAISDCLKINGVDFSMYIKKWIQRVVNKLFYTDLSKRLPALQETVSLSRVAIDNHKNYVDRGTQNLLRLEYQKLAKTGEILDFSDVGFRNFSQSEEDGILWYIFSLIGTTNRKAIEICAGNGIECNSANLIINHGWNALLVDGNPKNTDMAREFYSGQQDTFLGGPNIVNAWITAENVNDLIAGNGCSGEVDLLTIDVDGVDYWLWKAMDVASPRVVVVETVPLWAADRSVTVPYAADFRAKWFKNSKVDWFCYSGASLPAFVKLGKEKGYRLVGTNRFNYNAFFVRNDVADGILDEISAESCFDGDDLLHGLRLNRKEIENFEWEEV